MNDITALMQRPVLAAAKGCCQTLLPDDCRALVEALEKAQAISSELKPANLINKFYERYPVASFTSESVRAEALGYFMAGAELQCFGEFVKYEELCSDE